MTVQCITSGGQRSRIYRGRNKLCSLVFAFVFLIGVTAAYSESVKTYVDEFSGTELNSNIWLDSDKEVGGVFLKDGKLLLFGPPNHKRIETMYQLSAEGQQVQATAIVAFGGDLNKFGFRPDPMELAGPVSGYCFDTYERGDPDSPGERDHVYAVAWQIDDEGDKTKLLEKRFR